jgi:Sec-independent protein translocase protein TatA
MFGISFAELFIILLIAAIFVRPKDIPHIAKGLRKAHKHFMELKKEVMSYYTQFHDELEEIESETKYIIDQNGKSQIAYDVSDLKDLRPKKRSKKKKELTEYS